MGEHMTIKWIDDELSPIIMNLAQTRPATIKPEISIKIENMDQRITVKDIAIIAAVVNADDGKTPHWGKLGIAGGNTRSSGVQDDHGLYLKEIEGGKADTLFGQTHKLKKLSFIKVKGNPNRKPANSSGELDCKDFEARCKLFGCSPEGAYLKPCKEGYNKKVVLRIVIGRRQKNDRSGEVSFQTLSNPVHITLCDKSMRKADILDFSFPAGADDNLQLTTSKKLTGKKGLSIVFEDNDGNTLLKSPGKLINPTTVRAPYIGLPIPALRNPFIVSVVNDEDELLTEIKEFNFPAHLIPPETEAEVPLPSSSFTPSQPTTSCVEDIMAQSMTEAGLGSYTSRSPPGPHIPSAISVIDSQRRQSSTPEMTLLGSINYLTHVTESPASQQILELDQFNLVTVEPSYGTNDQFNLTAHDQISNQCVQNTQAQHLVTGLQGACMPIPERQQPEDAFEEGTFITRSVFHPDPRPEASSPAISRKMRRKEEKATGD